MQPDTIFSVVKECFRELYDPLKFIFDLSLEKRIFPDDLKIARFNPVFIGGDHSKCFLEKKSIDPRQFGFQVGHSTDLVIIQLDDQIFEAFGNNLYMPDVFIDLSKSLSNSRSHDIA